jgi:hypothetical protein
VVESSLLNLDFLRPRIRQDPWDFFTPAPSARPGTLVRSPLEAGHPSQRRISDGRGQFLKRLLAAKRERAQAALRPSDLPTLLGDSGITALGRIPGKVPNELKLRCTEFDENGNVTLVNGEFKKSELIAKVWALFLF